eukprot:g33621.t1
MEAQEARIAVLADLRTPSANAYRVGSQAQSEMEAMKRQVQSLLNKVCPENMSTIVEKISAVEALVFKGGCGGEPVEPSCSARLGVHWRGQSCSQVHGRAELEAIIELIFKKAVTEPHYSETYADLVFSLKSVFPDFPDAEGGKPVTFRSLVLNICQNEFEELLAASDTWRPGTPGEEHHAKRRKDRMCANMKFVGHLYLRQLLSTKVVGSIICELEDEVSPEEHALECACELLLTAGYTMDTTPAGQTALEMACTKLKEQRCHEVLPPSFLRGFKSLVDGYLVELKEKKSANGKGKYCKRIQFMIQDRQYGSSDGLLSFITQERASGQHAVAEHIVTGKRPVYLG